MRTQTIIPPKRGWEPHALYLVEACFDKNNPIEVYYFFSGHLTNGQPAGYNQIYGTDGFTDLGDVFYLKVLRCLHHRNDGSVNRGKLFADREL